MREIIQEYGSGILAACVALLLLGFVGSILFSEGKMENTLPKQEYARYLDTAGTVMAMERKLPVITWKNERILANTTRHIGDLFQAEDVEGDEAEVKVLQVEYPDQSVAKISGDEITFLRQGVYRICVMARDKKSAIARQTFCVPVVCR